MVKNTAGAYASNKISSSKWLLLLCAASAAAVDIIIIALLFAGGEEGEYLACPFILLIFDIFYFAVSLFFTNFRFKYSLGVWISYILLYTLGLIIWVAIILGNKGTVLTNGSIALWAGVHAFNIVCAVICALYASHVIKKLWLALIFAVIFLAGAATYAGYLFSDGFFGQGRGYRTLVYSYNSAKQEYAVTGVLSGKSDKVNVPATFNGKPVTKVSFSLLTKSGIRQYNLPESVTFTDQSALARPLKLSDKVINVDKKSVNEIRNGFLALAETENDNVRDNAIELANATLPVNLGVNEGYVAFNYDKEAYDAWKGNAIPVYVGDLSAFDLNAYTAGFGYVAHRDNGSGDNYDYAYKSGGYILSQIADGRGNEISEISESTVARLKFEKVYRISVDGGNDTKYNLHEKQPELCFDTVGGQPIGYKYLTIKTAETFLDGLTPRKGFSCKWVTYKNGLTVDGKYITDLPEKLEKDGDGFTLSTRWELNRPVLTVGTSAAGNIITYGEDVTIYSDVQIEAEGVVPEYEWRYNDEATARWKTAEIFLDRPKVTDYSGTYKLIVKVNGGEVTSLTTVANGSVELTIKPKTVEFTWDIPAEDELVYDGSEKYVVGSFDNTQLVPGDTLDYSFMGVQSNGVYTLKNAKTYECSALVYYPSTDNYDVRNTSKTVVVKPRPVQAEWSGYNVVYNGSPQKPDATATGVGTDGQLPIIVSGSFKNAGSYNATATLSDTNYTITNPVQRFTISKKPLNVTLGSATVVYGEKISGSVSMKYEGFVGGEDLSVLGGKENFYTVPAIGDGDYKVGSYPNGVMCSGLTSGNYTITYTGGPLTVVKRTAEIVWNVPLPEYDGKAKNVTATVGNKLAGDDVSFTVSGGNGITVDTYTATVTAITGADAGNYQLPEAVTRQYTVTKRTATVVWNLPENPVYSGENYSATYTIGNLADGDDSYFKFTPIVFTDAGTHQLNVVFENEAGRTYVNQNYNLVNGSASITVKPAQTDISVKLNGKTVTQTSLTAKTGDTLSWLSNLTVVGVQAYCSYSGNDGGFLDVRVSGESFIFSNAGEYTFSLTIPETSNYSGKEVTLTITVSGDNVEVGA